MSKKETIVTDKFIVQKEIFNTYLRLDSIRETAKHYGISKSTIHRIIQSYKKTIKKTLKSK